MLFPFVAALTRVDTHFRLSSKRPVPMVGLWAVLAVLAVLAGHVMADEAGPEVPAADWPMYRYDASRSASTPHELADELHLHWVRQLPAPRRAWPWQPDDFEKLAFDQSYEPVAAGGLHASMIRKENGSRRWVVASGIEGELTLRLEGLHADRPPGGGPGYTLRLHFAELEHRVQPGQRVFDVFVNGEKVLRGIDIAARTGGAFRGMAESFAATGL